ncbi:MAG: GNAT family N-acetyltransferase [Pseudomonadota bacterium]
MIRIVEDDLSGAPVAALLRYHLEQMHLNSPPGSVFAFDIGRLRAPDVTFWTAWDREPLLGCGAMKELDAGNGEIKSMRTAPEHLRKGAAAALLDHIVAVAHERGYRRLSLETGSGPAFDPALALYRRRGFMDGDAFGDYERTDFNQFLHLDL